MAIYEDPIERWDNLPTRPVVIDLLRPLRVLVADDDGDLRGIIVEHLRSQGCEVIETSRGDRALGLITQITEAEACNADLELLILDVQMPGMTGLDIAYTLRMRRWSTPILLITAFPDRTMAEEATRLGVALLEKPFDTPVLTRAIVALTS